MRMRFFTRVLFILLCIGLLVVSVMMQWLGHSGMMDLLIFRLQSVKNASRIYEFVTLARYQLLQVLLVAVLLSCAVVLFYFNRIYSVIAFCISDFLKVIKTCVFLCLRSEAKYILILPFLAAVWYAIQLPISYDEALTYLHFTSRGPVASLAYYPEPNNHILHSLITNITTLLPFLDICFCLRISSIFFNLLTWCIAYYHPLHKTNGIGDRFYCIDAVHDHLL